jgi:hypothetical protein
MASAFQAECPRKCLRPAGPPPPGPPAPGSASETKELISGVCSQLARERLAKMTSDNALGASRRLLEPTVVIIMMMEVTDSGCQPD